MSNIRAEHIRDYKEKGYFVLESVIPPNHLAMLRNECDRYVGLLEAEMDQRGVDVVGINHRSKRYFISNRHNDSPYLSDFIFSDLMADICRATLGDTAYLFHEQYVVKAAEKGMKFGWHQDSGYVGHPHKPYLTCWCPLDDVTVENGTVYMLPYERAGIRSMVQHAREDDTNDQIGYYGDDPGEPVIAPAGSIACFSSVCFHRSGPNTTSNIRRVYLPQYSSEIITHPDSDKPWGLAEPFLRAGTNVAAA
jgi:ectoine hydroxylase-related dioxygenase (phytanoyl-CoA dioxygenase family)